LLDPLVGSGRILVGTDDCAIDEVLLPIELTGGIGLLFEYVTQAL
jgi:hypothetical protein